MSRIETLFKTPLRQLDDTCCSIIKNTRSIKRIIRSDDGQYLLSDGIGDGSLDDFCCWSLDNVWIKFVPSNGKLKWQTANNCYSLDEMINDEDVDLDGVNKLIVYTYRELLDRTDPTATAVTVEDIMALADKKLKASMNNEEFDEFELDDLI